MKEDAPSQLIYGRKRKEEWRVRRPCLHAEKTKEGTRSKKKKMIKEKRSRGVTEGIPSKFWNAKGHRGTGRRKSAHSVSVEECGSKNWEAIITGSRADQKTAEVWHRNRERLKSIEKPGEHVSGREKLSKKKG